MTKERFSTTGTIENWSDASLEALKKAGFKNIIYNGMSNTISGEKDGLFQVSINPLRDGKIELSLESDSESNSRAFKDTVARIYQQILTEASKKQEEEPLGGIPEEYKPNQDERFKLAYEEFQEENPPEEVKKEHEKTRKWYETNWFSFLMLFLIPPLGIFLIWRNGIFTKNSRIVLTVVFALYTILWAWLIYLPFAPGSMTNSINGVNINETTNEAGQQDAAQIQEIADYWSEGNVANYRTQMPGLMSAYESLYINNALGTPDGNAAALSIFPQVQALIDPVLALPTLNEDNAAYALQMKVNESAQAFKTAIDEATAAINSGDINAINNSTAAWNNAQNLFYETDYVYNQAIMATESPEALEQPQTTQ